MQDGFIKYHGCGIYHRDGSNVLVTKQRPCSRPTNACFWMQSEHVHKKVCTQKKEYNATVYRTNHLKKQYHSELKKQNPNITFYSTDDETMSDSDSDSDSDSNTNSNISGLNSYDSTYDSDDNKLVIDIDNHIGNAKKALRKLSKSISNQLVNTINSIQQLPDTDQTPNKENGILQTPDNT